MIEVWQRSAPYETPPIGHVAWKHIARHEAGHAVAHVIAARVIYGNNYGFESVKIRPGTTEPYVDRRGRVSDDFGSVEGPALYNAVGAPDHISALGEEILQGTIARAEWEIITRLAGPFAEAFSLGAKGYENAKWTVILHDLAGLQGSPGSDGNIADAVHRELAVLKRRKRLGWGQFEKRTHKLVLQHWPAIDALGEALLEQRQLEFDDAYAVIAPHLPTEENAK